VAKTVEVAAAVMLRADGREFLLAQRPEGKVYAGYWEFPGGKVEPGETVRAALVRELQEELGITVTACSPWLTREFTYPHARVRLNFWRVTAWTGEIGITAPLEHSAVDWLACGKTATVAPILPANDPILKALSLPTTMAITRAELDGTEAQLERLEAALADGLRLIQVRDKGWPAAQRLWLAESVLQLARNYPDARVVINDDAAIARRIGADGVHLSAASLMSCETRPDFEWVGASCHNAAELARRPSWAATTPCSARCCRRRRIRRLPAWAGRRLATCWLAARCRSLPSAACGPKCWRPPSNMAPTAWRCCAAGKRSSTNITTALACGWRSAPPSASRSRRSSSSWPMPCRRRCRSMR
jgi:8-oxo-dGTP diphosphatase